MGEQRMVRNGDGPTYQSSAYSVQKTFFRVSMVSTPNENLFWLWCSPSRCDNPTAMPL